MTAGWRRQHAKNQVLRFEPAAASGSVCWNPLDEIRIGKGNLDYRTFLQELGKLDDVPMMMEHLSSAEEYRQAATHLRLVVKEAGLNFL